MHFAKKRGAFFPLKKSPLHKTLISRRERGFYIETTQRFPRKHKSALLLLLLLLMVEGRPKRACADGIDYAGTDQVPGWTVRDATLFPFFGIRVVEHF